MTKVRSLSQRYTVLFSLAVCGIFFLCMRCSGWIYRQLPQTIMRDLFFEFFDMLWPVALALLLGYGFAFRAKENAKNWIYESNQRLRRSDGGF